MNSLIHCTPIRRYRMARPKGAQVKRTFQVMKEICFEGRGLEYSATLTVYEDTGKRNTT
jgi:hypothetical protein